MAVRTHRDTVERHFAIQSELEGISGRTEVATATRRNVDHAALLRKGDGTLKDFWMTTHVRRTDVLNRQTRFNDLVKDIKGRRIVTQMHVQETHLARQHTSHAHVSDDATDFFHRREGATMVTQGQLHTQDFRNREEFGLDRIRDRRDRIRIVARPHPPRSTFFLKATHLG